MNTAQQISIPDLIRRMALIHLNGYPEGIQIVTLRKIVEDELHEYLPVTDKKNADRFRNCLSDIEKKYPAYVRKEVISPKNVVLKPTIDLHHEVDDIVIPDDLNEFFEEHGIYPNANHSNLFSEIEDPPHSLREMRQLWDQLIETILNSDYYQKGNHHDINTSEILGLFETYSKLGVLQKEDFNKYLALKIIFSAAEPYLKKISKVRGG